MEMNRKSTAQSAASLVDRPWLEFYPEGVPPSLSYPDQPVSFLMEDAARRFPDRRACTLFGHSATYRQLAERSRRFARSLAEFGISKGDMVAMLLPNIPEYLIALQGTWLAGAAALQLSPLMVEEELRHWLERTECRVVVTLDLLSPLLRSSLKPDGPLEHMIVVTLVGRMSYWKGWLYWMERVRRRGKWILRDTEQVHRFEYLQPVLDRVPSPRIHPRDDIALIAPTGGTTAAPKAVMLTHRNLLANAIQLRTWSRQPDGTADVLGALPFFHAYGLTVCVLSGMAMAATIHLYPRFQTKAILDLIEREKVAIVPAVPAMLRAMNEQLRKRPRDLSCVEAVISGAAPLPADVAEEFASYGPKAVVEGYGLSEASPVTHCNPLNDNARPGTIGVPLPDTEARIVDEETGTREMPVGEPGELIVRGPQVMKGYLDNPEETARALRDGWLYTGDIARRDADGFFTIVDRKKDIIKTSGFLVFPTEVEEVLRSHPKVAEAAVIGVPDEKRGEKVVAFVVPKDGKLSSAELLRYCAEHLAKHKRPRHVEIVDELPKNFLGKVQRRKVRARAAAG